MACDSFHWHIIQRCFSYSTSGQLPGLFQRPNWVTYKLWIEYDEYAGIMFGSVRDQRIHLCRTSSKNLVCLCVVCHNNELLGG